MNEQNPGDAFTARAMELDDTRRLQPPGEEPKVNAPDLEFFHETREATDRALAERFYRKFNHLFTNGDGAIHVYHTRTKLWTQRNVDKHVYALCMHLSDDYAQELVGVLQEIEQARAQERTDLEPLTRRRDGIVKMISHCEKAGTIGNVHRMLLAKLEAVMGLEPKRMNPDPNALACRNGVVDLRSGELRWPTADDYLTRNTGIRYDPGADYRWWEEVVLGIAGGNPRLAEFLQVWAGYCATGHTKEHCMAILWGMGRNGKNLFVDSVATALGTYASVLPPGYLEALGERNIDNNMMYALADMHGIRMSYASETGERGKLKESWVKNQTGDRVIRARLPYAPFFEFPLTHKMTIGTNHKPEITGTDDGVWERIRLVPFRIRFGNEEEVESGIAQARMNRELLSQATSPEGRCAVLKWVVDGARKYLAHGLGRHVPVEITAETKMYRREQDVLGQFLQDATEWINPAEVHRVMEIEKTPNGQVYRGMSLDDRLRVEKMDLWRIYEVWCSERGHYAMSATAFARRITSAQRFWQDDIGSELTMPPLESFKAMRAYFYRYIRLSEMGHMLRNKAMAKMQQTERRFTPADDEED